MAFYLPQLVQQLRVDPGGLVEAFLLDGASKSQLFAHHLICTLRVRLANGSNRAPHGVMSNHAHHGHLGYIMLTIASRTSRWLYGNTRGVEQASGYHVVSSLRSWSALMMVVQCILSLVRLSKAG